VVIVTVVTAGTPETRKGGFGGHPESWNKLLLKFAGSSWGANANTRYHGVELGQVNCGKQIFGCGI